MRAPTMEDAQTKGEPSVAVAKPVAKSASPTGPAASASAVRLADYKSKEHGHPAVVVPVKQPLRIYDFDIELEQPILAEPETRLPWIANLDERALFRGKKALILPIKARNDSPVARELLLGFVLHTRDGKSHTGGVYNERLAAKQLGRIAWFDLKKQAPDAWVETVLVFEVDPAQLDGAVVYVARWITVRDLRGRRRSVVEQHLVADLAAAKDGPPIAAAR
ncbi:MAG: hypothetical protein ACKV2T_40770 [Kofleriaceae bacterium]